MLGISSVGGLAVLGGWRCWGISSVGGLAVLGD